MVTIAPHGMMPCGAVTHRIPDIGYRISLWYCQWDLLKALHVSDMQPHLLSRTSVGGPCSLPSLPLTMQDFQHIAQLGTQATRLAGDKGNIQGPAPAGCRCCWVC
jgi:hypothetical protein